MVCPTPTPNMHSVIGSFDLEVGRRRKGHLTYRISFFLGLSRTLMYRFFDLCSVANVTDSATANKITSCSADLESSPVKVGVRKKARRVIQDESSDDDDVEKVTSDDDNKESTENGFSSGIDTEVGYHCGLVIIAVIILNCGTL